MAFLGFLVAGIFIVGLLCGDAMAWTILVCTVLLSGLFLLVIWIGIGTTILLFLMIFVFFWISNAAVKAARQEREAAGKVAKQTER